MPVKLANATREQRDELAGSHSVTSSGRASSGSGTVRPSAFAVLTAVVRSDQSWWGGSVAAWEYHHEPLAPFATAVPADEPDRRHCGLPRSPGQQSLCGAVRRTIADPAGLERARWRPEISHRRDIEGHGRKSVRPRYPGARHAALATAAVACAGAAGVHGRSQLRRLRSFGARPRPRTRPRGDGGGFGPRRHRIS